jgi:two-component system, NarL family, sensor histidine kinase UhpB
VEPRHGRDSPRRPDAHSRYARVYDADGAPAADRGGCETCGYPRADNPQPDVYDRLERQARAIAQALHDESGQLLSAAHLALSEIVGDVPEAVRARIDDVRKHLDSIEDQFRRIAGEMRAQPLEDRGLAAALEFLADSIGRRRGIAIAVEAASLPNLPPAVATSIYRVVLEALNNVAQHARATSVRINVRKVDRVLHCSVRDDGNGFDVGRVLGDGAGAGLDLTVMRERLVPLGGRLDVRSAQGRGTDLVITIPLED